MIPIRDTAPCHSRPIVTWTIMLLCTLIFCIMKLMPLEISNKILYLYGMVPIRYSSPSWAASLGLPQDAYFSFVSNLFLHADWLHLFINMWFLWIFADNVEDRMGPVRFLCFYLLCGILATILQWYFDPMLSIPVVGASGAIAGVLGAYFFLYPYARVIIWFPIIILPSLTHVPAIAFLGLWIIIQLYKATSVLVLDNVTADVAWWAHVGGFIAGFLLYRWFLRPGKF